MERKQFTFYASWVEAVSLIKKNKAAKGEAYEAIIEYALMGVEPDLTRISESAAIIFTMAKPVIDASRSKAENASKRGTNDEQTESKMQANSEQTESKTKTKREQTASNREQEKEKEKDKDKEQMLIARGRAREGKSKKGDAFVRHGEGVSPLMAEAARKMLAKEEPA